jgi:hypothetical protein
VIGVVLGQRGNDLITAGLTAAKQLVERLTPNAAGRPRLRQPGLAP